MSDACDLAQRHIDNATQGGLERLLAHRAEEKMHSRLHLVVYAEAPAAPVHQATYWWTFPKRLAFLEALGPDAIFAVAHVTDDGIIEVHGNNTQLVDEALAVGINLPC